MNSNVYIILVAICLSYYSILINGEKSDPVTFGSMIKLRNKATK